MGIISNKISIDDLKAGDHIYSWRHTYLYAHHGIYIGDGNVIHFTRGVGQEIGMGTFLDNIIVSSSPTCGAIPCPNCGDQSKLDGVISSCLECFLSGGNLYVFEYGVNPAYFLAKPRGGTCTIAVSDPPEDVLHRAKSLLHHGFGVYSAFTNNCEHFAIYCKTGLLINTTMNIGGSGQAASLYSLAKTAVTSSARYLTMSFSGLAVVGYGMYCYDRLVSDIGVRRDVIKVPVEMLVAQSRADLATKG